MDRVDTPITKPLPKFWSFCFFAKHFMTMGEPIEPIENLHYFSKLQKQRRKKKEHLYPLLSNFISSSFFVYFKQFEKLWKRYLKFYKPFWNGKILEWRPKILSSKIQTSDNCQRTSPWPPSLGEHISCSNLNLHQFEQFLLH